MWEEELGWGSRRAGGSEVIFHSEYRGFHYIIYLYINIYMGGWLWRVELIETWDAQDSSINHPMMLTLQQEKQAKL